MSSHRQKPSRRRRSGRTRALLSLGAVAFLALGFGAQGTFAFWSDSATVQSGTFTAGTLDITLNGALQGQGGSTSFGALSLTNMVPGESVSASFPVANNGSVPLNYTVNGSATGALASGIQFSVFSGTAVTNTGSTANGNRAGTCTGTAINGAQNVVLGGTVSPVISNARLLAASGPTATENICVVARLDPNANNNLQGTTMSASLIFNAKQVGA